LSGPDLNTNEVFVLLFLEFENIKMWKRLHWTSWLKNYFRL